MSVMPENTTPASPTVYQLRVVVRGVSPLIWRRLLVPADATIAGLHAVVQAAFGWGGDHLHRFVIHGTEYGISYVGGPGFRDDPHRVRLGELGLRQSERFVYEYNFFAGWVVDLRVEQILPAQPGRVYPRCTAGRRAGSPEDWDGPWAFLERTQPYLVFGAIVRAAQIVSQLLDGDGDGDGDGDDDDDDDGHEDVAGIAERRDQLAGLLPLLGLERFDRRALNHALARCAVIVTEGSRQ